MADHNVEDDEALARKLQEELNSEVNLHASAEHQKQLEADMALAKQLMEEEKLLHKGGPEKGKENETSETANASASMLDLARKQQEEMDMILAMKLQQGFYQESEFKYKAPPAPTSYSPNYPPLSSPSAPMKNFIRQKRDTHVPPTPECVNRITSDMKEVITSQNRFIHISPDEEDITHVQALIVGPPDTPYAYGFFHFDMLFPHDYPWNPPKVQLITTDYGNVRFNPNLYANGKVCLSILGTWSGPGWSSIQTMLSTLLSIQSLMNPKPYHNEPGFENERKPGDIEKYNQCIVHETLRVAVCGMMENPTCGDLFTDAMEEWFLERYNDYEQTCLNLKDVMDGKPMEDPFGDKRGHYRYAEILTRLRKIKEKIEEKQKQQEIDAMDTNAPSTEEEKQSNQAEDQAMDVSSSPQLSKAASEKEKAQVSVSSPGGATKMELENANTSPALNALPFSAPSFSAPPSTVAPDLVQQLTSSLLLMQQQYQAQKQSLQQQQLNSPPVQETTPSTTQQNPPAPPTPPVTSPSPVDEAQVSEMVKNLAAEAQKQLDLDLSLAKMLQEASYNEDMDDDVSNYGLQRYSQNAYPSSTSYTAVKPPSLSELKAQTSTTQVTEQDETESIVCLICHTSPREYIILPACQQPHIYCMSCANKMIKNQTNPQPTRGRYLSRSFSNKRTNANTIQCVLCSACSVLDPVAGLASLRRRKRRKLETKKSVCSIHNEEFMLFCLNEMELICMSCAASTHQQHNFEALDVAQQKMDKQLTTQMKTMEQKRSKLESFIESVRGQRDQLATAAETARRDSKEKFAALRQLLDEKEKEIDEAIVRTQQGKTKQVDTELQKAQDRIQSIDQSISAVSDMRASSASSPLEYLQKLEDVEEQVRHASTAPDQEVKPKLFTIAPFVSQYVEQALKAIKYRDRQQPHMYGIYGMGEEEAYDELEDEFS